MKNIRSLNKIKGAKTKLVGTSKTIVWTLNKIGGGGMKKIEEAMKRIVEVLKKIV